MTMIAAAPRTADPLVVSAMLAMSHPGSFRIALLSELSRAAILGYIASPRSSIIGKLPSRGTPSTDTAADAVKRPVPIGTDMRTYLSRLR